ncbi:inositol monophosphatase family protein [Salipiger sp. PrR002]|uniref:inositol monophosphatase family protein n=1 Tax=Salipiger sp. PrR002 TaxID=2706489 RepID=UPI0013B7E463|nr:inositol monophosphatase family protein [Salipiger sp. PrR002]NDW00163.1 inositol monophosphatase [Salipiger sp. PrR002]NDW56828.1 inositol monophosphatase [Salipiger sp. PrR004]
MLSDAELKHRRTMAEGLLREAGLLALEACRNRSFTVETKGQQDFVTEIDRQTEDLLRARLAAAFPKDAILGEEGGGQIASVTWILDPIDGTSNFLRGFPYWCLSAGLVVEGEAVLGVIYDPCNDEMFSAHKGGGATLNGTAMHVSETSQVSRAVFGLGFSFKSEVATHAGLIGDILGAGGSYRMPGAGALTLAHLAAGRIDGFWEAQIYPWDVAAGIALVREAGGVLTPYATQSDWVRAAPLLGLAPALMKDLAANMPETSVWRAPMRSLA